MPKQMWAMSAGINWNWFANIQLNDDGTSEMLKEFRLHKYDPTQGANEHRKYVDLAKGNGYDVLERRVEFGETRIATGLRINYVEYPFVAERPRFDLRG